MEACKRSSILRGDLTDQPAPEQVTSFFISHGISPSHRLATSIPESADLQALWKTCTRSGEDFDAPHLVKCTMFVRQLAPPTTPLVLVLTSAERVSYVVQQLRSYHRVLMISSDSWMAQALDILVAQPDDMYDRDLFSRISGVVVDENESLDDAGVSKAFRYLRSSGDFSPFTSSLAAFIPWHYWLTPFEKLNHQLLAALRLYLPETVSHPGLGDKIFLASLRAFADGLVHVRVQDWPGLVALIPGLFRAMPHCALVLVHSEDRLVAMTNLLQFFVRYMGLHDVLVSGRLDDESTILVATPDMLLQESVSEMIRRRTRRVVAVEADVLLLGFRQQIEAILKLVGHAQWAVHSSSRCKQADEFVGELLSEREVECFPAGQPRLATANVFLESVANETEKMDKLYNVWHHLGRMRNKMKLSVLCNSAEKVREVGEELRKRAVPVLEIHSGMSDAKVALAKLQFDDSAGKSREHTLVVTNVLDKLGADLTDVVVVEVPDNADEYERRAGVNRMRESRLVINIVCHGDETEQVNRFCAYHGVGAAPLPTKLNRLALLRNTPFAKSLEDLPQFLYFVNERF